jgi:hypothetical protein
VIVVTVNVHPRFVELVETARLTVPAKPLIGLTDTVAVPALLTVDETAVGLAVTVKSSTRYVTEVECDRDPLVPVTVAR